MVTSGSGFQFEPCEFSRRSVRWSKVGTRREVKARFTVTCPRQDWSTLKANQSVIGGPLTLGGRIYTLGLGTHAHSEIVIGSRFPVVHFRAVAGLDENRDTQPQASCRLRFAVLAGERMVWESEDVCVGSPVTIDVSLGEGSQALSLRVSADNIHLAHADWCDIELTTADGQVHRLDPATSCLSIDLLPLRFCYGGLSSDDLLPTWSWNEKRVSTGAFSRRILTAINPEDGFGLEFSLDEYETLPVSVWHVLFFNRGAKMSKRLTDVRSIDITLPRGEIRYAQGSFNFDRDEPWGSLFRSNFMLEHQSALSEAPLRLHAVGGRSSVDFMPYLNVVSEEGGTLVGIGWTGQWTAQVTPDFPQITRIEAGMEFLDTVLKPGEQISQPSGLLVDYAGGDFERGQNILRRFFASTWIPEPMRQPPISFITWGGMSQASHLNRVKMLREQKLAYDCYWIDAGWFGKEGEKNADEFSPFWSRNVGNWKVNPTAYPDGLRAIADGVHDLGMKFLVWFEPERAFDGTDLVKTHPEYFYEKDEWGSRILNLGNPEAERWMLDLVSGMMDKDGIDFYRQDFNVSPLDAWRTNDETNRTGISEIRHIEGLYRVLDTLRERHPNMLIDNCASGGRRLDFEMMHRSVPLWASDMQCHSDFDSEQAQSLVVGLNAWIPSFGFGTQHRPGDTYNFRSALAAGVAFHMSAYEYTKITDDYPYDWHRQMLADYHRAQPFMLGDYSILTPQSESKRDWQVLQFDRPDLQGGCVVALRRINSPYRSAQFSLKGLNAVAEYEVEDADSGTKYTQHGGELLSQGLVIEISKPRSSALVFYTKRK